jgi:hypothetical protein
MAITIKIGSAEPKKVEPKEIIKLEIAKSLNDDVMIFDHADIYIVIQPKAQKVVAYAKDVMSDYVYGAQNRLFHYLSKRGLVSPESIQGGNVYSSMESKYLQSEKFDVIKLLLLNIFRFIEDERPYFEFVEAYDDMMTDRFTDPTEEESTRLGEVPQSGKKGTVSASPFTYGNAYYWQSFTY